jgi:hypothetical protein
MRKTIKPVLTEITENEFNTSIYRSINSYREDIDQLNVDLKKLIFFYQETVFLRENNNLKYFRDDAGTLHYELYKKKDIGFKYDKRG